MDPRGGAIHGDYTIPGRSLALAGGNEGPLRVKRVDSAMSEARPLIPQERRNSGHSDSSHCADFVAKVR